MKSGELATSANAPSGSFAWTLVPYLLSEGRNRTWHVISPIPPNDPYGKLHRIARTGISGARRPNTAGCHPAPGCRSRFYERTCPAVQYGAPVVHSAPRRTRKQPLNCFKKGGSGQNLADRTGAAWRC